jgi:hypothetical protein
MIDGTKDFRVPSLRETVDFAGPDELPDTVRAALIVDNDSSDVIRFANAHLSNGMLTISIYETNETDHHKYLISVSNSRYAINYKYITSGESKEEDGIVPYETHLILSESEFKSGDTLKGYTLFKGKCTTCKDGSIVVEGTFEVVVK